MVIPGNDTAFEILTWGGVGLVALKIIWSEYLKLRGEKRADRAGEVVDSGYAKLVTDQQKEIARLNKLVEYLTGKNAHLDEELEKCRVSLRELIERQNKQHRKEDEEMTNLRDKHRKDYYDSKDHK